MTFPAAPAGVEDGAARDGGERGERRPAMSAAVLALALSAGAGALWLIGHGLSMQFVLSPTTEALEEQSTGRWLIVLGAAAGVLTVVGVSLAAFRRPRGVAAAFLAAALLLVPAAEIWASRQTSPPAGDVAEVEAFVLPDSFTGGQISDNGTSGEIERWWRVESPAADADACRELEAAFRAWADPGSVVVDPTIRPCYLRGQRGGGRAIALVVPEGSDLVAKLSVDFRG